VFTRQILISIACAAVSLPVGAASFVPYVSASNTYYVGMEDNGIGGPMSATSDYDYNDLIFSLTGSSGVTLEGDSTSALFAPVNPTTPTSTPPAFWNNTSYDGPGVNFGQCLYNNPTACNGPFAPTASYLAETTTQASSNFYFSGGGTVTLDILNSFNGTPADYTAMEWCVQGTTTCTPIVFSMTANGGVATFTPGGNFDLAMNFSPSQFYDTETTVAGVTDSGFDHFAVAVGTPEPGTLAVVGTFLVGLGVLRRRHNKKS